MSQRSRVVDLYKRLLHLGKDYPSGFDFFRPRLHKAFMKNKDESDPQKIEKMIAHESITRDFTTVFSLLHYFCWRDPALLMAMEPGATVKVCPRPAPLGVTVTDMEGCAARYTRFRVEGPGGGSSFMPPDSCKFLLILLSYWC